MQTTDRQRRLEHRRQHRARKRLEQRRQRQQQHQRQRYVDADLCGGNPSSNECGCRHYLDLVRVESPVAGGRCDICRVCPAAWAGQVWMPDGVPSFPIKICEACTALPQGELSRGLWELCRRRSQMV